MPRRSIIGYALGACLAAGGCTIGPMRGSLRAVSLGGDPVYLDGTCTAVFYSGPQATETTFVLTDVPLERLSSGEVSDGLVVHLDLLWLPEGGKTPMDSSATNVSIRYIVISRGEVGVYGGAGFALPGTEPGGRTASLNLEDASMSLLEATSGFVDLLSPARLTGRITARLDEQRTREVRRAASKLVSSALGRSSIVQRGDAPRALTLPRPLSALTAPAPPPSRTAGS